VDYGWTLAFVADVPLSSSREPRSVGIDLIQASERNPARVVIAGGGVAALEALLALRSFSRTHFEIDLVAPDADFHRRPLSVGEPFGVVEQRRLSLHEFALEHAARFHHAALMSVDPVKRRVTTTTGESIGYDALLLATGAAARPALPGALTFRGGQDVAAFRSLLDEINSGTVGSVAFAAVRRARWTLPLYELALMTAAYASARHISLRIEFLTHETEPMTTFGPRTSERVRQLLSSAGIRLRTSVDPIVAQPGRVFLAHGGAVAADRTVAVARLVVPPMRGIPQGPGGFIATDPNGRVDGLSHVYAAGDATWFPIKQGGIATQQADAAASAIAADAGLPVEPEAFEPVLRGILLTGGAPEYLGPGPHWPGRGKIAGRHLAPYLAGCGSEATIAGAEAVIAGADATALELALEAADAAAGWKDPKDALRWLDVAEGLNVALPMEYADKRREWTRLTKEGSL
jgi:sulfide:quinone oxidoreductase